jgi:IS6 family transposase
VTVSRWVLRFTPLLAEAARPCRHRAGGRWLVDERYVRVAGRWWYVDRASISLGRSSTCLSGRGGMPAPPAGAARGHRHTKVTPSEVVTDRAPTYPLVLEELPAAWHRSDRYADNRVEADHDRLKARLRPMGGLEQDRSARVMIAGHAFIQNLRRGHYELAVEEPVNRRLSVAFAELALAI